MNYGFDIHGVLDSNPTAFAPMLEALNKAGHEVHIITGGAKEDVIEFLEKYNFHYSHFFSIVDHHRARGSNITKNENGNWKMDSELWDMTKADYCRIWSIDFMIDDTPRYANHFTTPFHSFKNIKNV